MSSAPRVYADSSALVKLLIVEVQSDAMWAAVDGVEVVTSTVARVEVTRAVRVADTGTEGLREASELLGSCMPVHVTDEILAAAARLASASLRTLDAIHLASAIRVQPDAFLTYDRRLSEAASAQGLRVLAPA